MTIVLKRRSIRHAEEVLNALGTALQEARIYSLDHPRFRSACERSGEQVSTCFDRNQGFRTLTFTAVGDRILFQGIPLLEVGPSGHKLMGELRNSGFAGLQINRQFHDEGVGGLLRRLLGSGPDPAPESRPSGDPESMTSGYRLLPDSVVARILSGHEPGADFGDLEERIEGLRLPELKVSENNFRSVLSSYSTLLTNLESGRLVDFGNLTATTHRAVSLFSSDPGAAVRAATQAYFDNFTFHHSMNVCLLTTAVTARLVRDEEKLNLVSLAALLHDVGKSRVPAEILYKKDRLSEAEFECLKAHPVEGAEILLGTSGVPPLCVAVAFGHHLHSGPGAYPKLHREYHCDWITQLVSVVDVYEALTATRPYKKGFSSRKAFEIMLQMPGLSERRPIIKLLYDCVGPYPVGTIVELSTRQRAVVTRQNRSYPNLPAVEILTDEELNPLSEPVSMDLAERWKTESADCQITILRPVLLESSEDDPCLAPARPEPTDILGVSPSDDTVLMQQEG